MSDVKRIDAGFYTAYGEALNAGYQGTKAEFEEGLKKSAEYADNAQASATAAAGSATSAASSASSAASANMEAHEAKASAEAWATGGESGTPSETNNAEYYAGLAEDAKTAAQAAQEATEALEWAGLGLVVVNGNLCCKYMEG